MDRTTSAISRNRARIHPWKVIRSRGSRVDVAFRPAAPNGCKLCPARCPQSLPSVTDENSGGRPSGCGGAAAGGLRRTTTVGSSTFDSGSPREFIAGDGACARGVSASGGYRPRIGRQFSFYRGRCRGHAADSGGSRACEKEPETGRRPAADRTSRFGD